VFEGPSEGLAISADGLLLAFWRVGKGSDTLVVYDAKNKVEARTWRIADRFEGDKSGWDLAFGHDGHTLYARTYDQTGATPLKGFNINTGAVAMLHPNSYAAAEADNAVFFIGVSGTARSLLKIGGTRSLSTLVAKNFDYDSLSRGGSLRWLVAQNHRTKAVVIIDGKTDAMREIGKHESVATLSDGTLLLIKGNEVTIDGPLCEDRGRRVALDKSEGLVKDKLSLAMRQHRNVGPTSLPTKTLESIPDLNHP
jgi:hypothetical protein